MARLDRTMQTLVTNLPPGAVPDRSEDTVYGMLVADGMEGHAAGNWRAARRSRRLSI